MKKATPGFSARPQANSCRSKVATNTQPNSALSPSERGLLDKYEDILRRGLRTFLEVGAALIVIRDGRLYRRDYATFDAYCRERWGIGRTYAWRVTGAAERFKRLPPEDETPKPTSEFQMRPFLKLKPEAFPCAWKYVIQKAAGRRITSAIISQVVTDFALQNGAETFNSRRPKLRLSRKCSVGQVMVFLHEIRRRIQASQSEQALAALETIEQVLFELQ